MVINTAGIEIDLTASADQFGIQTPVSIKMDKVDIPAASVLGFGSLQLLIFAGMIFLVIKGEKLFKKR